MSKNFIKIRDAADLLGVSVQTLRKWEKRGALVPLRNPVNNYRVYEISQIEQFMENMRNERLKKTNFRIKVKVVESDSLDSV